MSNDGSLSARVHALVAEQMLADLDQPQCGELLSRSTGLSPSTVSRVLADWSRRRLIVDIDVDFDPQVVPISHLTVAAHARWRKLTPNGVRQLTDFIMHFERAEDFARGPIDRRAKSSAIRKES